MRRFLFKKIGCNHPNSKDTVFGGFRMSDASLSEVFGRETAFHLLVSLMLGVQVEEFLIASLN